MNTSMTDTSTRAAVSAWTIDPAHTQVGFEVKHMMFAKVRGRFEDVSGTLHLASGKNRLASKVEVSIAGASINTGQPQRDEHLRSGDFLDVTHFPELTFTSRTVELAGDDRLTVTGDLAIHGVTKEIELAVEESGRATDPWGQERIGFTATASVDRRDFGLTWNQALEAGGILVGNEVKITLDVQATRQAA